jgi:DNA-binding response OmpR family regulator
MGSAMKLLVVEDDQKLAKFLVRVLCEEGYVVDWARTGTEAEQQTQAITYDLVLLDWMLPGADGLSVCRTIRQRGSDVPILMLTARNETRERVLGLESGADDYVSKPFEVEELVARVRALLRRAHATSRLRAGPVEIDPMARRAFLEGVPMVLTARELMLLTHLVRNADRAIGRTELLSQVWETAFDLGSNVVEVHVSRLREKLGRHAAMITTVRGVGYQLRLAESS